MSRRPDPRSGEDSADLRSPVSPTADPQEVQRFLRPQPPLPIPPRSFAPPLPGLLAYALLGARVVTRYQQE